MEEKQLVDGRGTAGILSKSDRVSFLNYANKASTVIWMTDPRGQCIYVNHAWTLLTGQSESEAAGSGWLNALHGDDKDPTLSSLIATSECQDTFTREFRVDSHGKGFRWTVSSGWPQFDDQGRCEFYVGTVSPIKVHEPRHPERNTDFHLTPRECEVLELIASGKTSGEIGTILGISKRTVEEHVKTAMVRTDSTNRVQAVVEAVRRGAIVV